MRISYILFFISFGLWAQAPAQIELLPQANSIEDFEHQYKGCLENSECDQVMGLQLSRWKELIKKVSDVSIAPKKKSAYLELFRNKYGIPVEFYTYQKSQLGFKPLLFNSSCKSHNPKEGPKVLKGTAFLKGLSSEKGVVWRDQAQIEVPVGELLVPQPVRVYLDQGPKDFYLPLGDQPLFMKDQSLMVIKEEDGLFYALSIKNSGEWKILDLDLSNLSQWELKRSEVPCPKDETITTPKEFGVGFCKSIWNEDLKKNVVVKLNQGCVI